MEVKVKIVRDEGEPDRSVPLLKAQYLIEGAGPSSVGASLMFVLGIVVLLGLMLLGTF